MFYLIVIDRRESRRKSRGKNIGKSGRKRKRI
jgi:hypothetical protein